MYTYILYVDTCSVYPVNVFVHVYVLLHGTCACRLAAGELVKGLYKEDFVWGRLKTWHLPGMKPSIHDLFISHKLHA